MDTSATISTESERRLARKLQEVQPETLAEIMKLTGSYRDVSRLMIARLGEDLAAELVEGRQQHGARP